MAILTTNQSAAPSGHEYFLFSKFGNWVQRLFLIFSLWLGMMCLVSNSALGQVVSHEYPLKAVFLLNFAQFTDWPTNTFEHADSPFVIGVLGADPFGAALDDVVRDEHVSGHKVVVQRYHHVRDLQPCHILFISGSEKSDLPKITKQLKDKPILTVSDISMIKTYDVSIQFVTDHNKIHFRINLDSLKAANLEVSSKLLRVAEIVPDQSKP